VTTGDSYDRVAAEYAARIADELKDKPLDRALLERLAGRVRELSDAAEPGVICDLGCGPGHVGRYLHDLGMRVVGVDLSAGQLEQARRLNPEIEFRQGDMRALDVPDGAWSGIAAFYSIIHVPRGEVVDVLRELRRVLRPGGWLLLAFHVGDEVVHLADWWGHAVDLDFTFFRPAEMEGSLRAAGFDLVETIERPPYPDVEHPSHRAYVFARRPEK
jgi:SAM-dependent methyltransferase